MAPHQGEKSILRDLFVLPIHRQARRLDRGIRQIHDRSDQEPGNNHREDEFEKRETTR